MKHVCAIASWALLAGLLCCRGAWAEEAAAPSTRPHGRPQPVVKLTVYPVAVTRPAVQYKLLPELAQQEPGNAATLYLVAAKLGPDPKTAKQLLTKLWDELDVPPE